MITINTKRDLVEKLEKFSEEILNDKIKLTQNLAKDLHILLISASVEINDLLEELDSAYGEIRDLNNIMTDDQKEAIEFKYSSK